MTADTQNNEQNFIKEYCKMGISAITPITLAIIGELLSQKTKIGGNILYGLATLSSLYTAKVFYAVHKNNQKQTNDRDY